MVAFAGYSMPVQFDGIMAEHLWTREHAGLFDVSHMGQLTVHGRDADGAREAMHRHLRRVAREFQRRWDEMERRPD